MFDELKKLIAEKKEIEEKIIKKANKLFYVGAPVYFEKFGGYIEGRIIWQSDFSPRFKIRNMSTGKEYFVELYDLLKGK